MSNFLRNRIVVLLVRIALGAVFLYSAWPKIADPPAFAEMIWNYRILPGSLVNPMAIVLPWLELSAGIALVCGRLHKGAALVIGGMLLIFIAALSIDLFRGIAVDCGCFSVAAEAKTAAQMFTSMKVDLIRDFALLLLAVHVLFSHPAIAASREA